MKPLNLSFIAGLLICCLACAAIPAVSAEYYSVNYTDGYSGLSSYDLPTSGSYSMSTTNVLFYLEDSADLAKYNGLYFLGVTFNSGTVNIQDLSGTRIYSASNIPILLYSDSARTNQIGTAQISWSTEYNFLGSPVSTDLWIHIANFEYQEISSNLIYFDCVDPDQMFRFYILSPGSAFSSIPGTNPNVGRIAIIRGNSNYAAGTYNVVVQGAEWGQSISGTHTDDLISQINLVRQNSHSNFTVWDDTQIYIQDYSFNDLDYDIPTPYYTYRIVSPYGTEFVESFIPDEPVEETINVFTTAIDITTNSLIAGANVTYWPLDTAGATPISHIMTSGYYNFHLIPGEHYNVTIDADDYRSYQTQPIYWGMSMGDLENPIYMVPDETAPEGYRTIYFIVKEYADTSGDFFQPLESAIIQIDNKTLSTNSAGEASYQINSSSPISYKVSKQGYVSVSRTYTPSESDPYLYEAIVLRAVGLVLTDEPTPQPTRDIRTNAEKAESAFDVIFANIEMFATMSVLALFFAFVGWMTPSRKKR